MTRYLDRALAGDAANAQEWNEHVIAFHRAYPGSTEALVSGLHTSQGQTSYELLASRMQALAPDARAILDIGCGDGALLVKIARAYGSGVTLTGIDLCEADLARARERLPGATLVHGDAMEVDMDQKSQDAVTSHLAFMSMPELEAVLVRARESLRRPGLLAFVVEDPFAGGAVFSLLTKAVGVVRDRFPNFTPRIPKRAPMERDAELQAVLERAGFGGVAVEQFRVSGKLSADDLWSFVEGSYPFGLLEEPVRRALRQVLQTQAASIASASEEPALALRLVTAHA